jgi:hypothetical protein
MLFLKIVSIITKLLLIKYLCFIIKPCFQHDKTFLRKTIPNNNDDKIYTC